LKRGERGLAKKVSKKKGIGRDFKDSRKRDLLKKNKLGGVNMINYFAKGDQSFLQGGEGRHGGGCNEVT